MAGTAPADLPDAADRLYGLDPAEFTAARTDLAGAARRAGNDDLAQQIIGLRKPSTAAWAVNVLVRRRRADLQRLLSLADQLRSGGTPDPREVNRMAQRVVAAVVRLAGDLAAEGGHPLSAAVTEQVRGTLRAAMAHPHAAAAVLAGHLVVALQPAQLAGLGGEGGDGFDVSGAVGVPLAVTSLAGHAARRAGVGSGHPDETEREREMAAARTASAAATRRAEQAAARAADAARELAAIQDEKDELTSAVERTRQALREQQDRLGLLREQLTDAERSHRDLARLAQRARRSADDAARRLLEAESPPTSSPT